MSDVSNMQVKSNIGIDGGKYTTGISNDNLENEDFLKLMLEEMKMQDPTSPMDSSALMDSQLKMSTIKANNDMVNAMSSFQMSYNNSALANASNLIGKSVDYELNGEMKRLEIKSISKQDNDFGLTLDNNGENIEILLSNVNKIYN